LNILQDSAASPILVSSRMKPEIPVIMHCSHAHTDEGPPFSEPFSPTMFYWV
jgi:hypothetical protein